MAPLSADQVLGAVLLDLTLILLTARLLGTLGTRIGQPRVVGEIVAGILLGPTVADHVLSPEHLAPLFGPCASPTACLFPDQAREVVGQLGQIGLMLFSFLTALELDRSLLRNRSRGVLLVGLGVVALPIGLGLVAGPLLASPALAPPGTSTAGFALFLGVMMAATALPVMARILQERGLARTALGSTGIAASALATVVLFLTLAVAGPVAAGDAGAAVRVLGVAVGYLALMLFVVRPLLSRLTALPASGAGHDRPDLFATALVLLLASGLAAHLAGLTVIVGGFMAGLVLPVHAAVHRQLRRRLTELTRTMLLPVFLAFSGLQTDLGAVSAAAVGALVLVLVGGMLTKWGGGALLARASGLSWPESNVLGVLMNCPGVIVLVIALVGLRQGVITPAMQAGVVVAAVVSTALTGPLLRLALPRLSGGAGAAAARPVPARPGPAREAGDDA